MCREREKERERERERERAQRRDKATSQNGWHGLTIIASLVIKNESNLVSKEMIVAGEKSLLTTK
jgi:hypothetical protein